MFSNAMFKGLDCCVPVLLSCIDVQGLVFVKEKARCVAYCGFHVNCFPLETEF